MTAWKGVGVNGSLLARVAAGDGPVFETVSVPGKPYQARIIYGLLESGRIIQIGVSLEDDARFLETFRAVFVPGILIIMALSTLIGWFMAARALSGLAAWTSARNAPAVRGIRYLLSMIVRLIKSRRLQL